ncbi:hypothetical protein GCM10011332_00850 [Terasakiella brassicae]|uniref:Uncharacterized protein n=1 Tax=Terasakiella brassicae TaxID=1634917 RepID=A0A917F5A4_9PROT|nr:hypothetical protein [Terasakiella brassicae]GGF51477.1 hypothetical protein GCM10011332_00850 [Terasakiella brassicae]
MHDRFGLRNDLGTEEVGFLQDDDTLTVKVDGVMDLVRDYDVFLFSIHATLIRNGLTVPSGASLVPQLRKLDKRVGVFCLSGDACRDDMTAQMNRCGYSITNNRVLLRDDLDNLERPFPFVSTERVLMVCSDVLNEVAHAKVKGLKSLLIDGNCDLDKKTFRLSPDFVAASV